MKQVYLKDIKHESHPKEKIHNWDYLKSNDDHVRVYYKPNKYDLSGFDFYAVLYTGHVGVDNYKRWDIEETMIDCLYQGIALFDGIRHLYMGAKETCNYGYHYYPNIEENIMTLKLIRKLELKYCSDYE